MRYYKYIRNGYIVTIGKGDGGTEIDEREYHAILMLIQNRPTPHEGYGYRMTENYTWEEYELPVVDDELDEMIERQLEGV